MTCSAPTGGVQRVLTELRKLAERMAASQAAKTATPVKSELDDLRVGRLSDAQNRERPTVGD
jgi:hypothetical protein